MSAPPNLPSQQVIIVIVAVPQAVACLTTVLRLTVQYLTRKLWWDDFWAGFAQVCAIVLWAVSMELPMGGLYSRPLQIFSIIGMLLFYTAALWAAKISVAVTIVKLLAPGSFRTWAKWAVCAFGLMWFGLSVQRLFACGANFNVMPFCRVPVYTGFLELGTDLASDFWLVGAPLTMLWKIKLSKYHRRLIGGAFACAVATTIASIVHIYYIIIKDDVWTGLSGHIQVGVSLVVCNILVLSTYIYRRLHHIDNASERTTTPDLSPQDNSSSNHGHAPPEPTTSRPSNSHSQTMTADIKLTEFEASTLDHRSYNEEYTQNICSYSTNPSYHTRISFPSSDSRPHHSNHTPRSSLSITK
ncbi:hypothetical protein CVT24_001214 [Panaeolus cyanescens]|uniref:Rhodopsin domain-containing protein n=1 Tax=Panaeolus cyanescens TaxID=181874 RepID=A0A409VTS5_9AGAR|nr:hypothetical protein CVT24_001214 [Panaeolus cyanescens]